jgi:hypothetical protein
MGFLKKDNVVCAREALQVFAELKLPQHAGPVPPVV